MFNNLNPYDEMKILNMLIIRRKRKYLILIIISFSILINSTAQTVLDNEGNVYNTVQIGTQIWMKENLKTRHFNNGELIPTTSLKVNNDSSSVFQWSYNEDTNNLKIYGRLYTWFAANNYKGICPENWHVPNDSDWIILSNYLGGFEISGGKMKDTGLALWQITDTSVSNKSGFTALPGGSRGNSYVFNNLNMTASFWSSNTFGNFAFLRGNAFSLQAQNSRLQEGVAVANAGLAVRCIKDSPKNSLNLNSGFSYKIYPIPGNGNLKISSIGLIGYKFYITSLSGIVLLLGDITGNVTELDLSNFPEGVYFIRFSNDQSDFVEKIVIY